LIRRLGQADRAALAAHFIGLPREDRRSRFGGNFGNAAIQRHCDGLDLGETICFAALDEAGDVVGAALGFSAREPARRSWSRRRRAPPGSPTPRFHSRCR
jgi:hypothetical protein